MQLQICLVGANGPDAVGGLASYLRGLALELSKTNSVSVVARFNHADNLVPMYTSMEPAHVINHDDYQVHIIAPAKCWQPVLHHLVSLVARPCLQPLARWLYCRAYCISLNKAIPKTADVVHYVGNGWEMLGFAALDEARRRGAVFTLWPAVHPGTWGDSSLDILLYNMADVVFVQSEFERNYLIRLGVNPMRLYSCGLAPSSPPTGNAASFRKRHCLDNRLLILFIGRKDRGKGYHALRDAMAAVLADFPTACLISVGPDREPPYPPLPSGTVLDLGQADEAEKADALAACDVFCLPSIHESFGIVYVEAWSYGKPVIGGLAPAVQELITPDENGYCVEQDKDAIAAALIRLLGDPELRQRQGAAGQRLQQERFTWSAVLKVHQEAFQSALVARRRQAEVT